VRTMLMKRAALACSRKLPEKCVVIVREPAARRHRSDMHICSLQASGDTARLRISSIAVCDLRGQVLCVCSAALHVDQARETSTADTRPALVRRYGRGRETAFMCARRRNGTRCRDQHEVLVAGRSRLKVRSSTSAGPRDSPVELRKRRPRAWASQATFAIRIVAA